MNLKVGDKAPDFVLESHLEKKHRLNDLRGKIVVLAFFPKAWTPVWTNQIPSYEEILSKFAEYNTQVLGISIDHIPSLQAWAESMGGITYPLLSDFWPHGGVAHRYGVLRNDGSSERAIFLIDEAGIIRYIDIHDADDQPDNEVLLAELAKLNPEANQVQDQRDDDSYELPREGIVMYCTRYCPACVKARRWFEAHQIEYTEINVSTNPEAVKQVKKWADGNRTTPTLYIDGSVIIGWDEERVAELVLKE